MSALRRIGPAALVDVMLLLVAIVWGSTYLAAKHLVTPSTVVAVLALRLLITAVTLLPLCLRALRRATPAEIRTGLVLGGILASVLLSETYGIAGTSATNAGLIISLAIVFTPVLDSVVTRSWLPPRFFVAAVLAVVGVALLASGSSLLAPSTGDLLVLVAAGLRAVHVTTMHRLSAHRAYDSMNLTFLQMSVGAVVFCALSPLAGDSFVTLLPRLTAPEWSGLLYLAFVCTVFAFFVQMWAVRKTSPSRVSLLLGTEPVWAAVFGLTLGGEELGVAGLVGALLVIAGTGWGRRVERLHREREAAGTDVEASVAARVRAPRQEPTEVEVNAR
jgi:drug/metabolite transporter (DMT)-like permease